MKKELVKTWLLRLGLTLAMTFVLLMPYEVANRRGFAPMFWLYFAGLIVFSVAYIVWNRGFAFARVRREDLPENWSAAQKDAFLADVENRRSRSSFLLYLSVSIALCFVYDIIHLFIWGDIVKMFPFF